METVNIFDPNVMDCQIIETPEMMRLLKVDDLDGVRRAINNFKIPQPMDRLGENRCQRWTVGMLRSWNNYRANVAVDDTKKKFVAMRRTRS